MTRPERTDPAPRRPTLPDGVAAGLIVVAALWLHSAALRAPFFADDFLFLDQVRHRSLIGALTSPDPIGNFLRPVGRQLHFWWLARAGAESPRVFHVANFALFGLALVLMFVLVRRLAGYRAATLAGSFLALHYAADVPLEWASGSQDLLALTLALAAIVLHVNGRRVWAAPAYLLAMFSKETVVFAPVIAMLLDRDVVGGWRARVRHARPLLAATLLWGALWWGAAATRHGAGAKVAPDMAGLAAALVHLAQVALGLEWRTGGGAPLEWTSLPWVPLLLVGAAIALVTGEVPGRAPGQDAAPGPARARRAESRAVARLDAATVSPRRGPIVAGVGWALLGALPVAAVTGIWSAYYYLFALCGVALALGAALARAPRAIGIGVVVLLAWGSQQGRTLDEFATAPGAWTAQSHVNRLYLRRSMRVVTRYLDDLRRARPTLPPSSTVFFFGIPPQLAWQTGDGPLLRWAYRDSSLRSYYLNALTAERTARGPNFFFRGDGDSLVEEWRGERPWDDIALSMMLEDRDSTAREALRSGPAAGAGEETHYRLGWLAWGAGDTVEAVRELRRAAMIPDRGPVPELAAAHRAIAEGGDTLAAAVALGKGVRRHVLDPTGHALLADILLTRRDPPPLAFTEAMAARILAPEDPQAWRRWAMVQLVARRYPQAERTLERYFALGGEPAMRDAEAQAWRTALRDLHPGTVRAQRALREESTGRP